MENKDFLCVGKIVGSRGINGELKVEPWCDYPEDFYDIKNFFTDIKDKPLCIENIRVHKNQVLLKLSDVNDKCRAELYRGKLLYAFKKDIPIEEGRYFIEDLKGCSVYDTNSKKLYGELIDVFNTGASDIYSVKDSNGKEYLIPILDGTISEINLEKNEIYLSPIEGIFDV